VSHTRGQKTGFNGHHRRVDQQFFLPPLYCSGFCSKLRASHWGTSLGPFVCGARAYSLCSYSPIAREVRSRTAHRR
jgi:hypothetical protein